VGVRLAALAPPLGPVQTEQRITAVASLIADTLSEQPLFCDLVAHTPLNLERGVSFEAVQAFKIGTVAAARSAAAALGEVLPLSKLQASAVVSTATALAGAFWQMAAPGTELRRFYEQTPELAHAIVDVAPRLTDILSALMRGYLVAP
jgi:transcriptional regulator, TetR family